LKEVYGKDVASRGPVIQGFMKKGSKARVFLAYADGLKTTDGAAPAGFEIAGADKKFVPATAEIDGQTIMLSAEGVKSPKYIRYGWAVFMNPNLVNAAGLPTAPYPASEAAVVRKKARRK
jgi:sialate O-acetylesterase